MHLVTKPNFIYSPCLLPRSHAIHFNAGHKEIRGWAEKVHRLTMMQWFNLTKCGLLFNIVSPAVHTLLPLVLQRLDSCGIEALLLILEKVLNCRYDHIISPILLPSQVYFHFGGTENSQMVPNQENMEGCQPFQSHSHAQQPLQPQTCVQEHCPSETGPPSSVFQTVSKMFLVLLFKVLNYLYSVGFSGWKQCS